MLNIFQGKKKDASKPTDEKSFEEQLAAFPGAPKLEDMNMAERFAMKRFLKMSPEEQRKTAEKAMKKMKPEDLEKNKAQMMVSIEEMRKNKMISDDQYRLMKRKYGIK
jgi:flagellar biosynthesis component FlhA